MKVLHIVPDFGTGGAEKVILTYLEKTIDDPEFEFQALSLSNNQGRLYEKYAEQKGLSIEYLGQNIHDNSIRGRHKQIKEIRQYINNYNPEIVHIHLSILWMVCLATIGTKTKKIFHTLHSNPIKTSTGKNLYIDRLCYKLFRVTPICLNSEMKKLADEHFKTDKTLVLPNGIDVDSYRTGAKVSVRNEIGVDGDIFLVGHVGRFHKVKNHEKIIDVFNEVLKLEPNAELALVGEGNTRESIENKCKKLGIINHVKFLGTRSDINRVMQGFDAFIFPSYYEGLGIVMIEAQAAGLHCVMSDKVPQEVIVTSKVKTMSLEDPDAEWAKAILDIDGKYGDPKCKIAIYDIDNVITKLKSFYKEAVK